MAKTKTKPKGFADLKFRKLQATDNFNGFSLGDSAFTPLKTFAQKNAQKFEAENLTRTYVAVLDNKPKAYISIVTGEVCIESEDTPLVGKNVDFRYNQYPAVKIARLAVDKSFRGSGVGRQLVDLALGLSQQYVCPWIGCRFIMVDAKKESVDFYSKCGFTMLDTKENSSRGAPIMFLDLKKLGN